MLTGNEIAELVGRTLLWLMVLAGVAGAVLALGGAWLTGAWS